MSEIRRTNHEENQQLKIKWGKKVDIFPKTEKKANAFPWKVSEICQVLQYKD